MIATPHRSPFFSPVAFLPKVAIGSDANQDVLDHLNLENRRTVQTAIEVLIVWGLRPYLDPPIAQAIKTAADEFNRDSTSTTDPASRHRVMSPSSKRTLP